MARKKTLQTKNSDSSWLVKSTWLSSSLFIGAYSALGWSFGSQTQLWLMLIQERGDSITIFIEQEVLLLLIRFTCLVILVFISLCLTTPVALITFVFEKSLNSDLKAFISILLWSILAVFVLCSFDFVADILVIISANLLLRLDLQTLSLKTWQVFLWIIILATLAFGGGMILFDIITQR